MVVFDVSGELKGVYLTVSGNDLGTLFPWLPEGIYEIHEGIVGLVANVIALVAVSLATKGRVEKGAPMEEAG